MGTTVLVARGKMLRHLVLALALVGAGVVYQSLVAPFRDGSSHSQAALEAENERLRSETARLTKEMEARCRRTKTPRLAELCRQRGFNVGLEP